MPQLCSLLGRYGDKAEHPLALAARQVARLALHFQLSFYVLSIFCLPASGSAKKQRLCSLRGR